jgi:2-polyprenyl-3-methyl-5-hydroxy-6-metoxy-1,4-benzoquinol methylase
MMEVLLRIEALLKEALHKNTYPEEPVYDLVDEPLQPESVEVEPETTPTDTATVACQELLKLNDWPHAVDPVYICNQSSEEEKMERARSVIDLMIEARLEGQSFLDYGTGGGHVTAVISKDTKYAIGYDIQASESWKLMDGVNLTTDWEEVKKNGPYNIVLAYDVLDHIDPDISVIDELKNIRSVLSPNGRIYVRCHPWCSRHGSHLYHQINKAYAHLVFTDEELVAMGYEPARVRKIIHPLGTYSDWFKAAGLQIKSHHINKDPVEEFFIHTQSIRDRIKQRWRDSKDKDLNQGRKMAVFQMEQQFIDYVLA